MSVHDKEWPLTNSTPVTHSPFPHSLPAPVHPAHHHQYSAVPPSPGANPGVPMHMNPGYMQHLPLPPSSQGTHTGHTSTLPPPPQPPKTSGVKSESAYNATTRSHTGFSMSQPTTPRPSLSGSPSQLHGSNHAAPGEANHPLHSTEHPPDPSAGFSHPYPTLDRRGRGEPHLIQNDSPPFGATKYNHNVYGLDRSTVLDIRVIAKIERGFFLADNDWTCYRRNYFQLSGAFALQGINVVYDGQDLPCLVKSEGMLFPVHGFMLGITARVANSEKRITLIQHTPKRDKGPQKVPEPRPIRPGGNLGLSSAGLNQNIVTFERIQFKSATANNGKRRAAQQYYILLVDLYAKIENDKLVPVASIESASLVVRGRSPGHYAETDASNGNTTSVSRMNYGGVPPPGPHAHGNGNGNDNGNGGMMSNQQHGNGNQTSSQPALDDRTNGQGGNALPPPHHRPSFIGQAGMFPSGEYSPYEYPGMAYQYGHMASPHHPPPTHSSSPHRTAPSGEHPVSMMPLHGNNGAPPSPYGEHSHVPGLHPPPPHFKASMHERTASIGSTSSDLYPHDYASSDNRQHRFPPEHWARMRIASNASNGSMDTVHHPPYDHPQYSQSYHSPYPSLDARTVNHILPPVSTPVGSDHPYPEYQPPIMHWRSHPEYRDNHASPLQQNGQPNEKPRDAHNHQDDKIKGSPIQEQ